MGFEDRQYNRENDRPQGNMPGFQFGSQSIVLSLVVVNMAIFLIDAFTPKLQFGDGTQWLSHALAIKQHSLWQVWTFLTHGFAHASMSTSTGIFHVGGNMITLWFLGRPVEQRLGRTEFLRFYLVSIVVAGLGWALVQLAFNPTGNGFIVGASGAVSAVVILFVFIYPREQVLMMGVLPVPAWLIGVLLLVMNLRYAFTPDTHIAWEAHLIGAAFGVAYFKLGWRFERFDLSGFTKLFKPKSKLRVHNPDGRLDKMKEQADAILAKISEHGEQNLTKKEQRFLKKYSQQLRQNRGD
jgi:membrane associated rhomboid family serine protease